MQFAKCTKCKLSLPKYYLVPILVQTGKKLKRVLICKRCKKEIDDADTKRKK